LRLRSGSALPSAQAPENFLILIVGLSHLDCRAAGTVTLMIANNNAIGWVVFEAGAPVVNGKVAAGGTFTGTAGSVLMEGTFAGDSFQDSFTNARNCLITVSLKRSK
jgi:hypothetical protein